MTKICCHCHRDLSLDDFGPNARYEDKHHYYCRKCASSLAYDRRTVNLKRKVREIYNGRCVICDGKENLEIISTAPEMKKRDPKAMVLICAVCKREGIPTITKYLRSCLRCGHRWFARTSIIVVCPKCKSPYWFREALNSER